MIEALELPVIGSIRAVLGDGSPGLFGLYHATVDFEGTARSAQVLAMPGADAALVGMNLLRAIGSRSNMGRRFGPRRVSLMIDCRLSCLSIGRVALLTTPPNRRRARGSRTCRGRRRPAASNSNKVQPLHRRRVRVPLRDRAGERLRQHLRAAGDVAADEVGIVPFEDGRVITLRARMRSRKPGANRSTCASIRSAMSNVEPLGTCA
jgi:hypothetical protein